MKRLPLSVKLPAVLILLIALFFALMYRPDIPLEKLLDTYAGPPSNFIEIEGMRVHYRIQGKEGSDKKPLVLLHGTFDSLHTWEGWVQEFGDERKIITLDLPGFGLTGPDPRGNYSTDRTIKFLNTFLDKTGAFDTSGGDGSGKIHIGGNSLGGRIAWNYALEYPQRCASLILVDAAGYRDESATSPVIFRLADISWLSGLLSRFTPKFIFRRNLEAVYGRKDRIREETVTRYYELNRREGNRSAFLKRRSLPAEDNSRRISTIDIPTLIIWGEEDSWISPSHAHRFHQDIEDSKLVLFPDAGHVPMLELPRKSAEAVETFLADLPE